MDSNQYPRRVLLAVTGLSPQVVTETLFALATMRPDEIPTEVHVVTTVEGAQRAKLALLSENPGWFRRLVADYGLPPVQFVENNLHVLCGQDGQPLTDIRNAADNLSAADGIVALVKTFTADPSASLHVSIAGGRKTMGFFLGYALSLFGRAHDRLSHVLVSEPFESSWNFFYPTPYESVIEARNGELVDCATAEVTLADIPFVSLRHGLPQALLSGSASFRETVEAARLVLGPPELVLDPDHQRVRAGGKVISLPRVQYAMLAVFARRAAAGEPGIGAPAKDVCDMTWGQRYLAELHQTCGTQDETDRSNMALRNGMDGAHFSQCLSKLQKSLRLELGTAAGPYLIQDGGTRPRTYRLVLPPDAVSFGKLGEAT